MDRTRAKHQSPRSRALAIFVVIAGILLFRFGDIARGHILIWLGLAVIGLLLPPVYLVVSRQSHSLSKPLRWLLVAISVANILPTVVALAAVRLLWTQDFGHFDDAMIGIIGWGMLSLILAADVIAIGRCFVPRPTDGV